jgi:hypothetical protein
MQTIKIKIQENKNKIVSKKNPKDYFSSNRIFVNVFFTSLFLRLQTTGFSMGMTIV